MPEDDDPDAAAVRLEEALERIAMLARRRQDMPRQDMQGAAVPAEAPANAAEMAQRLDALIARVRSALD
ncbi:MAG TPA: hypothetical protein VGC80_16945 [Acetobacteraceae bacterium]